MKRRNLLATLGALGTGGAAITSTGAFTSASANRDLKVNVVDDENAYLSIKGVDPNSPYIDTSGGEFSVNMTNSNNNVGGTGVNPNAITVFEDLFQIQNQGTQEVDVSVTPLTYLDSAGGNSDLLLVLVVPETSFPGVTLGVGDIEKYSLIVIAFTPTDASLSVDDTITITAEATS